MSADDDPSTPSDHGRVELSVPAQAQYASTVRTLAASLGADAGFSVDELDDIRLALSEVFSALADTAPDDPDVRVHVSFEIGEGSARIAVRADGNPTGIDLDELALSILRSVTDDFEVTSASVVLVKHATEAAADSTRS